MSTKLLTTTDFKPRTLDESAGIFGKKIPLSSREFDTLKREARARAFRIATVNKVQLIDKAMREVRKAIRDGTGIREVQLRLMRLFGEEGVTQLPLHRLRLVLRQNQLGAYNIARKRVLDSPAVVDAFPYRMYLTVGNGTPGVNNVRDEHAKFHGMTFAWNDSFWSHFHPPWGWNCRCFTRPVSQDEVDRSNLTVYTYIGGALVPVGADAGSRKRVEAEPDPAFDFDRDQIFDDSRELRDVDSRLRAFLEEQLARADNAKNN